MSSSLSSNFRSHFRSNVFQNDENAIPKQKQMKQLSSSSVLKPKKGLSLKPMNNGNGNGGGGVVTFPKTPSASSSTSSGKSNTRRRALGDISNRKGDSRNHAKSTKSIKGKGGSLGGSSGSSLTIHNDNLKYGSMSMATNKKSLSTKKSTKKKKKNVTFDQQIYQDALDNSYENGKALESKKKIPLGGRSIKAAGHQTIKSSLKLNKSAGDVEDAEMSLGPSLKQERSHGQLLEEEEERLQIDLLIGGVNEFDDEKYRKLREEEEFDELSRQVDESFGRAVQDIYKYEEVDHSQFMVFEDGLYSDNDLLYSGEDDTDNDHSLSNSNLNLIDISI